MGCCEDGEPAFFVAPRVVQASEGVSDLLRVFDTNGEPGHWKNSPAGRPSVSSAKKQDGFELFVARSRWKRLRLRFVRVRIGLPRLGHRQGRRWKRIRRVLRDAHHLALILPLLLAPPAISNHLDLATTFAHVTKSPFALKIFLLLSIAQP